MSGPITSVEKLKASDHTVVVFVNEYGEPDGYAKVGLKDLFFYLKNGKIVEFAEAKCLLDFYVSESLQRRGIGLQLFTRALTVPDSMIPLIPFLPCHINIYCIHFIYRY